MVWYDEEVQNNYKMTEKKINLQWQEGHFLKIRKQNWEKDKTNRYIGRPLQNSDSDPDPASIKPPTHTIL